MKKIFALTTALAALATVASIPAAAEIRNAAFAETAPAETVQTVYPENLEDELSFSSLSDYAVNGDVFAFAEGTTVTILQTDDSGDRVTVSYDCGFEIKNLDYCEGDLYFGDAEGKAYVYPDKSTAVDYNFTLSEDVHSGSYTYFIANDSLYWRSNGAMAQLGGGYSLLKSYDGRAYTVKDQTLYLLDGVEVKPVDVSFTNFDELNAIAVGSAAELLKSAYTVKTATVESGAYCTEIDMDDVSGEYFTAIKTVKLNGVKSALVLAESGNASIIAMSDGEAVKGYITLTSALSPTTYRASANDATNAYTLVETHLYASPFISGATAIATIPQMTAVSVTEKFSLTFIDTEFYRVSYTDADGALQTGFVAAGYLSAYSFAAENNTAESVSDEFVYTTNVQNVILVLVIVGLVIIAIAYLTAVGTKQNRKKKAGDKKSAGPEDGEDEQE